MSGKYASNTTVSEDKSRADIEKSLRKYGAQRFLYGWDENCAVIAFTMRERQIRFYLPMPDEGDREFTHTPRGQLRSTQQREIAIQQERRRRWRAFFLVIKGKLEAVETGIMTFEDEFLANTVLPDGSTVGKWIKKQMEVTYRDGTMPKMLPYYNEDDD